MEFIQKNRNSIAILITSLALFSLGYLTFSRIFYEVQSMVSIILIFLFFLIPIRISSLLSKKPLLNNLVGDITAVLIIIFSANTNFWRLIFHYWWIFTIAYLLLYVTYLGIYLTLKNLSLNDDFKKIAFNQQKFWEEYPARIQKIIQLILFSKHQNLLANDFLNEKLSKLENLFNQFQSKYLVQNLIWEAEELTETFFEEIKNCSNYKLHTEFLVKIENLENQRLYLEDILDRVNSGIFKYNEVLEETDNLLGLLALKIAFQAENIPVLEIQLTEF